MAYIGTLAAVGCYLGSTPISASYLGTKQTLCGVIEPFQIDFDDINGATSFRVPFGHLQVRVIMIGGGGSGAGNIDDKDGNAGGGFAGAITETIINVQSRETLAFTLGQGGASVINEKNDGNPGLQTTLNSIGGQVIAIGGSAGLNDSTPQYEGRGHAQPENQLGIFYDGEYKDNNKHLAFGGEAGFGKGGDGEVEVSLPQGEPGLRGSGGGGAHLRDDIGELTSGAGGNGLIRIESIEQ